ncbi:MAG: hypothetical protein UU08_C0019G0022 [Candidatus Uhrbacteria bacterium GW2011_GWE2_40_58]|nr:MAG: hypothetical protein UT94_C0023G0012 [Candidatus Uhrbacteria bacterium GW2011_GWF2_40_263]KKR67366.1 MAG: hypothetical protein UU08_C0019G0022 [Candidatus Uhrbacteria bacterium GW2011_GWE2_40_58]OGL96666.1 MAG: hypothetical protein A2332_01410 [Candidatus Uhrbacteria bacterium RIFOXYB2_FULL_41_18]HBK34744.1 hypothetical protein [Candidatus Uhrbacteria bacterium]HCB55841.1 hypothetical protein [Candidatus Uhrbacteria bacterium]
MSLLLKADCLQDPKQPNQERSLSFFFPLDLRLGFVFVLASIEKAGEQADALFPILTEQVQRLAQSFGKNANAQHRFEQFLSALNESLADHVRVGDWSIPIEHFHGVVGIACGEQMFLSGTGELTAIFLHKKPSEQFQIFNLSRSIQTEQALPTWEKAFAVVLDGELHAGDVFCLANQELQRNIPSDELHTLLANLPPTGALEKMRQYFALETPFSALILQAQTFSPLSESTTAKPLSELSIEQLGKTEQKTTSLLEDESPKTFTFLTHLIRRLFFSADNRKSSRFTRFSPLVRTSWRLLTSSCYVALKMILGISVQSCSACFSLTQKQRRQQLFKNIKTSTTSHFSKANQQYRLLPRMTKYLILAVILVILVFSVGLSFMKKSKADTALEQAYLDQIAATQELFDRAQSAYIYKDEVQARTLYAQAQISLSALPMETPEQTAVIEDYQIQINTALDELRHVVHISDPPLLGDLKETQPETSAQGLSLIDGVLSVLGSDDFIYSLDKSKKTFSPSTTTSAQIADKSLTATDDNSLFFVDERPGISEFTPSTQSLTQHPLITTESQSWRSLLTYADRLYALIYENEDAQIYRYSTSAIATDSASSWIKSKETNLSEAVDFAIDGTLFVLLKNGTIIRFVSGSEVSWNQGIVEPAVEQAVALWTDIDSNYLYVLEPVQERLIIFEKETGNYLVQYKSGLFADANSFVVDESTRSIFLLIDSKIYTIAASHL